MVNQLLAMARAEHEEPAVRQGAVNLALIAREAVRDFVPRALERQIDLGFEGPPGSEGAGAPAGSRILGSALLLRELVRNLVDNALLYTPGGGRVTVRVIDDPFGQVAVLQVEDSGPGIPPAEREQVFRPFYRALGTGVDGSGLGLAIVREIATRHGAEVTLADADPRRRDASSPSAEAGPGALFTVRFPAAPAAAAGGPRYAGSLAVEASSTSSGASAAASVSPSS
jgi:two-component system sensor histidine kinase TctE